MTARTKLEERHRPRFAALAPDLVTLVWIAVRTRWSEEPDFSLARTSRKIETADALFEVCRDAGLDHARVVLALAGDGRVEARAAIETLVGRPIRPWVEAVEADGLGPGPRGGGTGGSSGGGRYPTTPRLAAPPSTPRRARAAPVDPRVVKAVAPCPYKPSSARAEAYARWIPGARVDELVAGGLPRRSVCRDVQRGYVAVEMSR